MYCRARHYIFQHLPFVLAFTCSPANESQGRGCVLVFTASHLFCFGSVLQCHEAISLSHYGRKKDFCRANHQTQTLILTQWPSCSTYFSPLLSSLLRSSPPPFYHLPLSSPILSLTSPPLFYYPLPLFSYPLLLSSPILSFPLLLSSPPFSYPFLLSSPILSLSCHPLRRSVTQGFH